MPTAELATYTVCLYEQTCADREAECTARLEAQCDECYSYVFDLGYVPDCSRICDSSRCFDAGCGGTRCGEHEERAVRAVRDEAVFASCVPAWHHQAECLGMTVDAVAACEVFARREGPWVAPVYDCIAATACDADFAPCSASLPREGLADHVTQRLYAVCGSVADGERELWGANDGWLKPAYRDALEGCLERTGCDAVRDCITAIDAACQPS